MIVAQITCQSLRISSNAPKFECIRKGIQSGTIPQQGPCGYGALTFDPKIVTGIQGLQNGPRDAIALVHLSSRRVIQFITYEGTLTAITGPAAGMTSTDVGVSESDATAAGSSIQLTGTGNNWGAFTWSTTAAASPGSLNPGQSFSQCTTATTVSYANVSTQDSDPAKAGYYNYRIDRKWTATDRCGNPASETQIVTVRDTTAPVITLMGANLQIIECSSPYVELGATATDSCSGNLTSSIVINASAVNTIGPSDYLVTYDVTDAVGNPATQVTRTVRVQDTIAPIIPVLADVTGQCAATIASAPTTTDNCSGTITGTTADPLTRTTQGISIVTWSFDDGHGQIVTAQQRIVVDDTVAPIIPVLADVTGQCAATIAGAPTTTDNCSGTITGTTSDLLTRTTQGISIVIWSFDDGHGQIVLAGVAIGGRGREAAGRRYRRCVLALAFGPGLGPGHGTPLCEDRRTRSQAGHPGGAARGQAEDGDDRERLAAGDHAQEAARVGRSGERSDPPRDPRWGP
jgi:hypothetical protein